MTQLFLALATVERPIEISARKAILKDRLASGTRWLAFDSDSVGYKVDKGDTLRWADGQTILEMGEHGSIVVHNAHLKFCVTREVYGYDDLIIFDFLANQIGRQTIRE